MLQREAGVEISRATLDGWVMRVGELLDLDDPGAVAPGTEGSIGLGGEPEGTPMGHAVARRGHMVLLPARRAYRFSAALPSVILLQTIFGRDTVEKWSTICQTMV